MKKKIGFAIAHIGAKFWEKGGFWNKSQRYEDLNVFGKLGFKLFCKGLSIAGITQKDIYLWERMHT